jgi:hypothetical protein
MNPATLRWLQEMNYSDEEIQDLKMEYRRPEYYERDESKEEEDE